MRELKAVHAIRPTAPGVNVHLHAALDELEDELGIWSVDDPVRPA